MFHFLEYRASLISPEFPGTFAGPVEQPLNGRHHSRIHEIQGVLCQISSGSFHFFSQRDGLVCIGCGISGVRFFAGYGKMELMAERECQSDGGDAYD